MATPADVRRTTFTTPSDREVAMTRLFDARRELVFEAFTNPDHVRSWLGRPGTMTACEIDLRVGGAYRFVWQLDGGGELEITGTYREIIPPERLVSTEAWSGEWPETLNTLVFAEEDAQTRMTLTVRYPSQEARDAALATGMNEGAARSFDQLAEHLHSMS